MPTIDLGPCECCGANCVCGEHPLPSSITAEVIYLSLNPSSGSGLPPEWVPTLLGLGVGDQYSGVLVRGAFGLCGYGIYAELPTDFTLDNGNSLNPCTPPFLPTPALQYLGVSVYVSLSNGTFLPSVDAQFNASGIAASKFYDCHTGRTFSSQTGKYRIVLPEMQCESTYTFDVELLSGSAFGGPRFRNYYLVGLRITLF